MVDPQGHVHIESFQLDGRMPVWRFACGDLQLEMRVWLEPGADTVYVAYRPEWSQASGNERSLGLEVKLLVNARDHHGNAAPRDFKPVIEPGAEPGAPNRELIGRSPEGPGQGPPFAFRMQASGGTITVDHSWYDNFDLPGEPARLARPRPSSLRRPGEPELVSRRVAGYPWFRDWGRDTMIALPSLTLATGRFESARRILETFARFIDGGMLPNVPGSRGAGRIQQRGRRTLVYRSLARLRRGER